MKLYMFRTVPLPIIRSYSLYEQQDQDQYGTAFHTDPDPAVRKLSTDLYDIYHC
jgi:hypothetical protein